MVSALPWMMLAITFQGLAVGACSAYAETKKTIDSFGCVFCSIVALFSAVMAGATQ